MPQSQHQQLRRCTREADTALATPAMPAGPATDATLPPPGTDEAAVTECAVSGCAATESAASPVKDGALGEGLTRGWTAWLMKDGRTFYWHEATQTTTWKRPPRFPTTDCTPRSPTDLIYDRRYRKRSHQPPTHTACGGCIRDVASPGGRKYRAVTLPPISIYPPSPPKPAAADEERPPPNAAGNEQPSAVACCRERPPDGAAGRERPLQSAADNERPPHGAAGDERPLQSATDNERPPHGAAGDERPPHGAAGDERTEQRMSKRMTTYLILFLIL